MLNTATSSLTSRYLDQGSSALSLGAVYIPYVLQFVRLLILIYYCSKLV